MRSEVAALLDHVSLIGQELSPDSVELMAAAVAKLPASSAVGHVSAPTARQRMLLRRLGELWKQVPDVDPLALSLALRSAQHTASQVSAKQTVELVWTGPRSEEVPVRRSDQALLEVIGSAEQELLLVSYAVFNVPKIADSLAGAVERGALVQLVLEFEGAQEGDQSYDPLAALGELPERVNVYHSPWKKRPEYGGDRRGYIHVKCAVADRNVAFVSSANLTAYAMEANMELGVLVRGGVVPRRIANHFQRLMALRVLELAG